MQIPGGFWYEKWCWNLQEKYGTYLTYGTCVSSLLCPAPSYQTRNVMRNDIIMPTGKTSALRVKMPNSCLRHMIQTCSVRRPYNDKYRTVQEQSRAVTRHENNISSILSHSYSSLSLSLISFDQKSINAFFMNNFNSSYLLHTTKSHNTCMNPYMLTS